MNLQALFLVATAIATRATAKFTVTSETTQPPSTMANVTITKKWTLTADSLTTPKFIDSIELDVVGLVYVSYDSNLPSGVVGYVNVSGDSQTVIDAVTVRNAGFLGNNFDHDTEKLRVCSTSTTLSGYLLTEIFLASPSVVTDVKSQQTAEVVIEDGVLATRDSTAELEIEASGSSVVFVSAPRRDVIVEKLELNAIDKASLYVIVNSVSVATEAEIKSKGSARITLLASLHEGPSFKALKVELEAKNNATICIDADVTATTINEPEDTGRISMRGAANSYGLFTCGVAKVPAREAACLSSPSTATGLAVAPPRPL